MIRTIGIGLVCVIGAVCCGGQDEPVFEFPGVQAQSVYEAQMQALIASRLPEGVTLEKAEIHSAMFVTWVTRVGGAMDALPYGNQDVRRWLAEDPQRSHLEQDLAFHRDNQVTRSAVDAWLAGSGDELASGLHTEASDDLAISLHATGLLQEAEWLWEVEAFASRLGRDMLFPSGDWPRQARLVARALRGVVHSEARRGLWDLVERDLKHILLIARVSGLRPELLGPLSSSAMEYQVIRVVHDLLVELELSREQHSMILNLLLGHPEPDAELGIESERVRVRAAVDSLLRSYHDTPMIETSERMRAKLLGMAPRDALMAEVDAYFDSFIKLSRDDAADRAEARAWFERYYSRKNDSDDELKFRIVDRLLPSAENFMRTVHEVRAQRNGLIVLLALELFEADHGAYPDSLDQLTPAYLEVIPGDPHAPGRELRYRRRAPAERRPWPFVIYSVGRNGVDDDGVVVSTPGYRPGRGPEGDHILNLRPWIE